VGSIKTGHSAWTEHTTVTLTMALGNFEIVGTPFGRVLVSLAQPDGVRVCLIGRMIGGVYPGTDAQECASIKYSSRMRKWACVCAERQVSRGGGFLSKVVGLIWVI